MEQGAPLPLEIEAMPTLTLLVASLLTVRPVDCTSFTFTAGVTAVTLVTVHELPLQPATLHVTVVPAGTLFSAMITLFPETTLPMTQELPGTVLLQPAAGVPPVAVMLALRLLVASLLIVREVVPVNPTCAFTEVWILLKVQGLPQAGTQPPNVDPPVGAAVTTTVSPWLTDTVEQTVVPDELKVQKGGLTPDVWFS